MPAVDSATRARVLNRAGRRCESCGSAAQHLGWSVHHRRPRGAGGSRRSDTNQPQNLLLLDGSGTTGCHGFFESNRQVAYDQGILVRQGQDPADVPVLRRGEWVLLAPDGTVEPAV
jgi:hypothetical protein